MAFNHEVYNAPVIYVIAPSIWVLIDLPLPADFLPAHPSDCFTIDLPNVPVASATKVGSHQFQGAECRHVHERNSAPPD